MAVNIQSEEARIIRQMIPLSTLPTDQFADLCAKLHIEHAEQGQVLFKRGDENNDLYYLLDGSINLQTESFKIETISAGADAARFAIAHQIPRKVDAVAVGRIQFLRLNPAMMKSVLQTSYEENESTMMVEEFEGSDDWMTMLLKSPVFRELPPANLQKVLISLQEVRFKAGETIIRQGDPGDYYYIVKKGRAMISRKPSPAAKEIKLAQLNGLDSFGEDSLISGEPRNVSITAVTDISLLRLGKEQFITLIKQPTLKYIEFDELDAQLKDGAALIDVRDPDEFKKNHLPRSVNVPFFSLRMYMKTLNRNQQIVVVCKNGRTSESAAFVLQRFKYNALILKGGIDSLTVDQLKPEPALFSIDDGTETGNFSEPPILASAIESPEKSNDQAEDLRELVNQLKARCNKLEAEKTRLEMKCASLTRQLERMKEGEG